MNALNFEKYKNIHDPRNFFTDIGKITRVVGLVAEGYLPGAFLGSLCEISPLTGGAPIKAEVVGFRDKSVILMPFDDIGGVGLGSRVELLQSAPTVPVGRSLLGRVIDAMGKPLDGKGDIELSEEVPLYRKSINPLMRDPIRTTLDIGVRAINGLLTVGRGQRIGIMAGSGVGKSVLMGMMARYTEAEVNVIALVGERGREVREFIENDLGPEGLKKSVVIVATSDQGALMRVRAAFMAMAVAEYFADQKKQVLFMMDSSTRFAMAQREIGLSAGEPPTSKGYTPSVFSLLPRLLERAGNFSNGGSITGFYTVLVEGDDMDEPIADAIRSIVDGHIVLTRSLAQKAHFPAIDVLQSISRVMKNIVSPTHYQIAQWIRQNIASYREAEDLINIGAYKKGSNPQIDSAIQFYEPINQLLRQEIEDSTSFKSTVAAFADLAGVKDPGR